MGIDGLPRRYFAYIDQLTIMNLLTVFRVLFTASGWLILGTLLYAGWVYSVSGIGSGGSDWTYGSVLPLHTHIELPIILRGHVQNLLETS
jgi:heme/copper-type cytochrome/quinol oxidase subunit 1